MLWLYQRTMFGKIENPANENLKDLNSREWLYLLPLVALCFWIGLYPKPFFHMLEPATAKLTAALENSRPAEYRLPDAPLALSEGHAEENEMALSESEELDADTLE